MGFPAFNLFHYVEKLQEAGFTEKQAKIQAEAISELIQDKPVSIEDVRHEVEALEKRLDHKFESIDLKINAVKNELLIDLSKVMVKCISIATVVLGALISGGFTLVIYLFKTHL